MEKSLTLHEMANTGNKWAVVAFDETSNWDEKIAKKAEKIEGVYLINLFKPTHLCSLTVSFPAEPLKNFFKNIEGFDEDEITEMEMVNPVEDFKYFEGSSVPKFIRYYKKGKKENVLENERANPSYC